jgi:hypothetical protein
MKRPPFFFAHIQLCSAARTLPTWSRPVGDGAKRVTIGEAVMRAALEKREGTLNLAAQIRQPYSTVVPD